MKKQIFLVLITFVCLPVIAEEIGTSSITALGEENPLRFVEIEDETFISWSDLRAALPNWFVIVEGQIQLSSLVQLAFLSALEAPDPSRDTASVVESNIDGTFNGWDGDTVFELRNGQIWQQNEYAYNYSYGYSPDVWIVHTRRGWLMFVEGEGEPLRVKRIR